MTKTINSTVKLSLLLALFLASAAAKMDVTVGSDGESEIPNWAITYLEENRYLSFGYCMTYDDSSNIIARGRCPYTNFRNVATKIGRNRLPMILPKNISQLNDFMCGYLNREGLLCAECKQGYGPAVYSFGLTCEKCDSYGWVLYIVVELIPITIFFFIVILFRLKVTSPPMNVFVFFAQSVVNMMHFNSTLYGLLSYESNPVSYILLRTLLAFYGIWNLDFFRYIVPPFCISSSIKNIHVLIFEFISAFYPLFLILITYICIEMHGYNFRIFVWLWKPFHKYFVKFRRSWNITTSMIDVFATFLLLSYSKLVLASVNLLCSVRLYHGANQTSYRDYALFFDPTVTFGSKEHIPFALFSIFILFVFVLCPVLLLVLYPTRLFRKYFSFCQHHYVQTFLEAFQGCYKDGTNGTRDYRSLSGLYLALRIVVLWGILYIYSTQNSLAWMAMPISIMVAILVITTVRPYKNDCTNRLDSWILTLLQILCLFFMVSLYFGGRGFYLYSDLCLEVLLSIPMVVFLSCIVYKVMMKTRMGKSVATKIRYLNVKLCGERGTRNEAELEDFPDRVVNPQLYESLEYSCGCNSQLLEGRRDDGSAINTQYGSV